MSLEPRENSLMVKANPRKRAVTAADIKRAAKVTRDNAITYTMAIVLTVLADKEGYGLDGLIRVWDEINELAESITEGYVNVNDLRDTLLREYGIKV